MTAREFCYWLQGYMEIGAATNLVGLNDQQLQAVKNHLNLVFHHEIDPSYSGDQQTMQKIHDGTIGGVDKNGNVMRC